jgi:hypothetical protein
MNGAIHSPILHSMYRNAAIYVKRLHLAECAFIMYACIVSLLWWINGDVLIPGLQCMIVVQEVAALYLLLLIASGIGCMGAYRASCPSGRASGREG